MIERQNMRVTFYRDRLAQDLNGHVVLVASAAPVSTMENARGQSIFCGRDAVKQQILHPDSLCCDLAIFTFLKVGSTRQHMGCDCRVRWWGDAVTSWGSAWMSQYDCSAVFGNS
jgi:hypothetical protein